MSGSEQHDQVAFVSMDDLATIGELVNMNLLDIDFAERQTMVETAQQVLRRVAQYTEPTSIIHRMCHHPAQTIILQKQITDLWGRI